MRIVVVVASIACALAACASSAEIEQNGYNHLARSQALAARGDYYGASKEREAADKQFVKARHRAADEHYYGYGYGYANPPPPRVY